LDFECGGSYKRVLAFGIESGVEPPHSKFFTLHSQPSLELEIRSLLGTGSLELGTYRMNWLQTSVLLFVAFLVVFLQSTINGLRFVTGAQIDLLPSLMVYAGLNGGLAVITSVAIFGGLLHDSLSANALGVSILPLFAVGVFIHYHRGMILKEAAFARFILGVSASAAVPVATLILLSNTERQPLIGWFFLWQLFVMSLLGGLLTPLWFRFFDWATGLLSYRVEASTSFRPDRQIKRGRQ